MSYFDGKSILVTGGTGSFGKRFIETVLCRHDPRKLIVFSRDELKQCEMQQDLREKFAPESSPSCASSSATCATATG